MKICKGILLFPLMIIAAQWPASAACASLIREGTATAEDSDGDGIKDSADNCPFCFNQEQSDSDKDGIGDLCDNCFGIANAMQSDTNNNGIGDACDSAVNGKKTNWITKDTIATRSRPRLFMRPMILWAATAADRDSVRCTEGVLLHLTGSIDKWKKVSKLDEEYPPQWFYKLGVYFDPNLLEINAGMCADINWRPMTIRRYARSFLKEFLFGVHTHCLRLEPRDSAKKNSIQLGAGGIVGFLDVLQAIPYYQWDAADKGTSSWGLALLFDVRILSELGIPFTR